MRQYEAALLCNLCRQDGKGIMKSTCEQHSQCGAVEHLDTFSILRTAAAVRGKRMSQGGVSRQSLVDMLRGWRLMGGD